MSHYHQSQDTPPLDNDNGGSNNADAENGHAHAHDGSHDGHGHGHSHDEEHEAAKAMQHSLYRYIDFDNITTLNESEVGSGRAVVKKTWAERMQPHPEILSSADDQLLMSVPFTGQIKLFTILVRTSLSDLAPDGLKVFINRDIDFATAEVAEPTQKFELARTSEVQPLSVRRAAFSECQRLTLFFTNGSVAAERSQIAYLGFRGEWTRLGRAPVSILYEAAPNPTDHAIRGVGVRKLGSGVGGARANMEGM